MKRALLVLLMTFAFLCSIHAATAETREIPLDADHFPDPFFREYLQSYIDSDEDGRLSGNEITVAETYIGLLADKQYHKYPMPANMTDAAGIEYLHLRWLAVNGTQVSSLDLKGQTMLKNLICYDTKITSLDISDCPYLVDAYLHSDPYEEDGIMYYEPLDGDTFKGWQLLVPVGTKIIYDAPERISGNIALNWKNFPNGGFLQFILAMGFDADGDGTLSATELEKVRSLSLNDLDVESLEGIEYFTSLTRLSCHYCRLGTLDLRRNHALEYVYCDACSLPSLDVYGLEHLETLVCSRNKLTQLDLTGCDALEYLDCSGNQITVIDLTPCPSLIEDNILCSYTTTLITDAVTLPGDLERIEAETFTGIDAQAISIGKNCGSIGSRAFADCTNLKLLRLPKGVEMAGDALSGCPEGLVIMTFE